jgi:hypothetical protein
MASETCKVPHLRYSMRKTVDVNRGLARNWARCFNLDSIRVPEGWEHALEINGRMYSFAFCSFTNATKCADGEYIMVIDRYSREQALGREAKIEARYYALPVMSVLRPTQEDGGTRFTADEYLRTNAACTFTESCLEKARRAKTIKVN